MVTKNDNELMHYGVKGMKWGVIRKRGISGTIRDIQRNRAEKDLADIKTQQRQVKRELSELRGYDRNPSKIGKSKISTAIRRSQIKSLEKMQKELNYREKDNQSAIKELDQIERYQAKRAAEKMINKYNKVKIKDLEKRYGELEDSMEYGKKTDAHKNERIQAEMENIESEIKKKLKKK